MISRARLALAGITGLSLWMGVSWLGAAPPRAGTPVADDAATMEKVAQFVRERFGIPSSVKITPDTVRSSTFAGFDEAMLTMDDGKKKGMQSVYLTKDRHFLIVGNLSQLMGPDANSEIVQRVRDLYKVPATTNLIVGSTHNSPLPNFSGLTLTADDGKHKGTQEIYLSKDSRVLVLGSLFDLSVDPSRVALKTIVTANQASQGPAHAPVTIVEYADLQCPTCARVHEFLEKELVPKYGDKVRIIFKEYPLVQIHDWTLTASIANQCVYQILPEAYVPFRSLVYQNQPLLNSANVRERMLAFGDQVGVDRVKLAACVDAKASMPRIDANVAEAKRLDVERTPTCFINGRMMVGLPSAEDYFKAVDDALRAAK